MAVFAEITENNCALNRGTPYQKW